MKAIVYRRYGPPDVLSIGKVEKPSPQVNELLIEVRAAEATKSDCELRSFRFPVQWFSWPLRLVLGVTKPKKIVLGGYFSGIVRAVGGDVTKFKPGDCIFGSTGFRFGAYGAFVCLPEDYTLSIMPKSMDFTQAASVPLGGLNALHFMRLADISPGDKVLINGAGGSIGLFAVQIAKSMGATVTAVDSGAKAAMLRGLGADHVIDYTQKRFWQSDQIYDVMFNMVAGTRYRDCIKVLKPGGRFLTGNPRLSDMMHSAITNWFSSKSARFAFAGETVEELETLKTMIDAGKISAFVDKVYSMEDAATAHRKVETEQRVGAIVLDICDAS